VFEPVTGAGVCVRAVEQNEFVFRLARGGEKIARFAEHGRTRLKNLFQQSGVPPWERRRTPMLMCGDIVVWVPGMGIDHRFLPADDQAGWNPGWHAKQ
jgi:tRNA(Ile)-lysidine synthase